MIIELIYNLSVLVALSVITGFVESKYGRKDIIRLVIHGILFGVVAIIGMMSPFVLTEGVFFDGRSIVISLCTLFFGPVSGIISSLLAASFRIYLGGGGALTGVLTVISSFSIGYLGFYLRSKNKFNLTKLNLYLFGIVVNGIMMLIFLTLPSKFVLQAFQILSLTIMGVYPLITVVIGKIISDQEERRLYLRKIEENEHKFRTLYNNAPLPFQSLDKNGNLIDVNPMWLRTLGYKKSEVIGKSFGDFLDSESHDKFLNNFPLFKKRGTAHDVRYTMKTKSGKYIFTSFEAGAAFSDNGKFLQSYCVFKDISDDIKIQKEIIEAKEQAEESDKLKTAFLQNMSHEIRTPLNGILGFASLLSENDFPKDEIKSFAKIIRNSGQRLLILINNIIDFAKIASGNVKINYSAFSLNNMMRSLLNQFEIIAQSKNIDFTLILSEEDHNSFIESDYSLISQVLSQLINNAIKFTNKGKIEVGYIFKDSEIIFSVQDTGIGIPEEHRKKIFNSFYQADMSIAREYEGAGLGLAISDGVTKSLHGRIEFKSELNEGSTFYFYLPLKRVKYTDVNITDTNITSKKTILIAEDDETSFNLLKIFLKNLNFDILRAKTGQEAVDICESRDDIKFIFMDVKLPELDGFEATKLIKQFNPNIKIVALTAYAFKNDKQNALNSGCDDYLAKPVDKSVILECIDKYI